MSAKENQVFDSAEKVEAACQKSRGDSQGKEGGFDHNHMKIKGVHLCLTRFTRLKSRVLPKGYSLLRKPVAKEEVFKGFQPISTKALKDPLSHEPPTMFQKALLDTHKCCSDQDLHLFNTMKIFCEGHSPIKKVACWKLPKSGFASKVLQDRGLYQGKKQIKFRNHQCKQIVMRGQAPSKKEQGMEKNLQEHLEMEKRQKETRHYSQRPSIFS